MIARAHLALAALLACVAVAHATGLAPGTTDPHVARFLGPDLIAEPRSVFAMADGTGALFVRQPGLDPDRARPEVPHVPLPWSGLALLAGLGALVAVKRKVMTEKGK